MREFKYNDEAVRPRIMRLMMVKGIDRHIITGDACKEVADILSLASYKDAEELRGVRNSVVKLLRENMKTIDDEYETLMHSGEDNAEKEHALFEESMRIHSYISAITAVIDRYMFKIDPSSV